jgi:hypothetical protein
MTKRDDIGYLVGWFGGILPPFGWALAMAFAAKGQRRQAFQTLVVGWWTAVLFILSKLFGNIPGTNLIMLSWHVMPIATLFVVRRSAWPPYAEPDEVAADSTQNEKTTSPTSAAVQAVIFWALVVVGLAFALSSPGSYGAGIGAIKYRRIITGLRNRPPDQKPVPPRQNLAESRPVQHVRGWADVDRESGH